AALRAVQAMLAAGLAGGVFLLVKRIARPPMRRLSHPDDYIANGLTTGFVALAFARTLCPAAEVPWLGLAMLLFLYVPIGKIRHCFFFFATRIHAGTFFGRRGVLPPHA
ncbi:MAG: hypothetical protein QUU85_05470, partial [Candidatus Eisenbacteria bacterium]|nr:hypothetical protein [Candidatus Eisenbacteria bacterium]